MKLSTLSTAFNGVDWLLDARTTYTINIYKHVIAVERESKITERQYAEIVDIFDTTIITNCFPKYVVGFQLQCFGLYFTFQNRDLCEFFFLSFRFFCFFVKQNWSVFSRIVKSMMKFRKQLFVRIMNMKNEHIFSLRVRNLIGNFCHVLLFFTRKKMKRNPLMTRIWWVSSYYSMICKSYFSPAPMFNVQCSFIWCVLICFCHFPFGWGLIWNGDSLGGEKSFRLILWRFQPLITKNPFLNSWLSFYFMFGVAQEYKKDLVSKLETHEKIIMYEYTHIAYRICIQKQNSVLVSRIFVMNLLRFGHSRQCLIINHMPQFWQHNSSHSFVMFSSLFVRYEQWTVVSI